ncbi:hypothetical protein [Hyphococcus sp.]|uniref:hypothetical protein n=1 Tax=Hyphococcus sp. TaxID=2038636 RepID=UPI0035C698EC
MSRAKFAELCQISGAMVTKHQHAGRIALRHDKVDAKESLTLLEGSLDEEKRREALKRLAKIEAAAAAAPALFDVIEGGKEAPASGAGELAEPQSWKARRDMFAAKEAELAYLERMGALVPAAEIAEAIQSVIAAFWTETERNLKIEASEIASELGLDGYQACELKAIMMRRNRSFREAFSQACSFIANDKQAVAHLTPPDRTSTDSH